MKDKLIEEIIKCLEEENKDRGCHNKALLDIPFMIAPLVQNLSNKNYQTLLSDIERCDYGVYYREGNDNEWYGAGQIFIQMSEKSEIENDDNYFYTDNMLNYEYQINFTYDQRDWGYCQCEEGDDGYDARYGCCGHGCDWSAPSFSINKIESIGGSSFNGDEHDMWDYRDKYNKVTVKDKKEQERLTKIKNLKEQQEYILKQLVELED